jgi:starch phosphorylase
VETTSGVHVFNVRLSFGGLNPDTVRVELYADRAAGSPPICTEMKHASPGAGTADAHLYVAQVPADRPAADFTARVVPHYDGVAVPLEAGRILWQR